MNPPKKTRKQPEGLPQAETLDKLGNCAELVGLAELAELVTLEAVPVVVGPGVLLPLPLVTDDLDADVESLAVDDTTPCDDTTDVKSWRMKKKGMGRCQKFIRHGGSS